MFIQIAGVTFGIQVPESLIIMNPNPFYTPFVRSDIDAGHPDIDITLDFNHMPETKHLLKIFDGGESWSMWKNSDHYLFTLSSPASDGKLICAAEFDSSVKNVTVHHGELPADRQSQDTEIFNPFSYPLDQVLLMYFLAQKEGALIHAAGINIHGRGYIFPGKSGAGKTTMSKLLIAKNHHGLLSDDRIVVRKTGRKFIAFGTPWPGEGKIAVNKSVPLSGIFFMMQSSTNRIEEISPQKALEKLLPVISIPWYDAITMNSILSFCEDLISSIPAYTLSFRPDREAVDVLESFISK